MDSEEILNNFIGPPSKHLHQVTVDTPDGDYDILLEHDHTFEAGANHTHTMTFGKAWRTTTEAI